MSLQTHFRLPHLIAVVAPAAVAWLAVSLEPALTQWGRGRVALLPLATLLLLSALLHPRLRALLMITLCYGVSFLALRDIGRVSHVPIPPPFDYDFIDALRPTGLILVALLSATSAVAETLQPGTVWARRCYFGAAALYFMGLGLVNYAWHSNWQSVLLCVTGVTAAIGCVFAHRIIATEAEESEEVTVSDERLQQAREAAHRAALQAKEWRDTLVSVMDEREHTTPGSV